MQAASAGLFRIGPMVRLSLLLLALPVSPQAAAGPAARTIPGTCAETSTAAAQTFHDRGFEVSASTVCPGCLSLRTTDLRDPHGHRLDVRAVMRRLVTIGHEQDVPGAWYVHSHLTTTGELTLHSEANGCRAQLLFHYAWYATEFLVIVPVDGDAATRPSNLALEGDYLRELAKSVAQARPSLPGTSVPSR